LEGYSQSLEIVAGAYFELENFLWINALNCYNAVGLFMEALRLDCLVEHFKMDVTLLVINEVQVVCCAILLNTLVNNSSIARC
jgi:hypothetical protein